MKSLELNKPHVIVVVGLPGAGKSFFAKQFSDMFKTPYVDYNYYHRLTDSREVGDVVATELLSQLFLTKQTLIIEGRGETKEDRAILARLAQSKGYTILYVWVQTEPATTYKRSVTAKDAPYTEEEYQARVDAFAILSRAEAPIVISGKHTYASQAKMVLRRLAAPRTAAVAPRPPRPTPKSGRVAIG